MVQMVKKEEKTSATLVMGENRKEKEKGKRIEKHSINLKPDLAEMYSAF